MRSSTSPKALLMVAVLGAVCLLALTALSAQANVVPNLKEMLAAVAKGNGPKLTDEQRAWLDEMNVLMKKIEDAKYQEEHGHPDAALKMDLQSEFLLHLWKGFELPQFNSGRE